MRTQVIEKAPQPVSKEAPMTAQAVRNKYTIWGTRAVEKPQYLLDAEAEAREARSEYDWLINNGVTHEGALTDAWDAFTEAENKRREAWKAYQSGADCLPIPF
mgnify:CR=1 FL=1